MKIELKSIGKILTPYYDNAPYQPVEEDEGDFIIVLNPEYQEGLFKLDTFKYIYVIYYIDKADKNIELLIYPPWADNFCAGIFSSRSPVRPNPIGISIVKIKNIVKNKIYVTGLDVFNNTPLIDIKPYIKDLDSKIDSNYGWLDDLDSKEHLLLHIKGAPHDHKKF
jgi:tRNA (adenine37-N6)-methyltransferase